MGSSPIKNCRKANTGRKKEEKSIKFLESWGTYGVRPQNGELIFKKYKLKRKKERDIAIFQLQQETVL